MIHLFQIKKSYGACLFDLACEYCVETGSINKRKVKNQEKVENIGPILDHMSAMAFKLKNLGIISKNSE